MQVRRLRAGAQLFGVFPQFAEQVCQAVERHGQPSLPRRPVAVGQGARLGDCLVGGRTCRGQVSGGLVAAGQVRKKPDTHRPDGVGQGPRQDTVGRLPRLRADGQGLLVPAQVP
ncbi:hypothetical protein GCM10022206_15820 [Streptomyces chiangmaiensis]